MAGASQDAAEEGFSNVWSICGFVGGLIFVAALLPQIHHTYATKSAGDLSYFWQGTFLLGLAGLMAYSVGYQLWPVAAPLLGEFALMIILTMMKVYYDNVYPKRKGVAREGGVSAASSKSALPLTEVQQCGDVEISDFEGDVTRASDS